MQCIRHTNNIKIIFISNFYRKMRPIPPKVCENNHIDL